MDLSELLKNHLRQGREHFAKERQRVDQIGKLNARVIFMNACSRRTKPSTVDAIDEILSPIGDGEDGNVS